jgi:hypothetical protein
MDVLSDVFGGIKLNYPIYIRNIKSSCGNISAQKNSLRKVVKLVKSVDSFLLFLLTVNIKNLKVYIVKQIRVKFDGVARGEKDHDFLVLIFL